MATTPRASRGPNWNWRWWSRGRSLTCWSWTCPRGTGGSTCAGCRSLKSTRTAGRPHPTPPLLPSSEVRAGFIHLFFPLLFLTPKDLPSTHTLRASPCFTFCGVARGSFGPRPPRLCPHRCQAKKTVHTFAIVRIVLIVFLKGMLHSKSFLH